jgi:hypothetical protein
MTEIGSTVVEAIRARGPMKPYGIVISEVERDALLAVVEAAQEWAERDDRSCSHSDVQECVDCEMEIFDLAQAIKPKLAALSSQASDEGGNDG